MAAKRVGAEILPVTFDSTSKFQTAAKEAKQKLDQTQERLRSAESDRKTCH